MPADPDVGQVAPDDGLALHYILYRKSQISQQLTTDSGRLILFRTQYFNVKPGVYILASQKNISPPL